MTGGRRCKSGRCNLEWMLLVSVQANSEISVLHLINDRPNCSGILLLSTFFVSCYAYYMRICI